MDDQGNRGPTKEDMQSAMRGWTFLAVLVAVVIGAGYIWAEM